MSLMDRYLSHNDKLWVKNDNIIIFKLILQGSRSQQVTQGEVTKSQDRRSQQVTQGEVTKSQDSRSHQVIQGEVIKSQDSKVTKSHKEKSPSHKTVEVTKSHKKKSPFLSPLYVQSPSLLLSSLSTSLPFLFELLAVLSLPNKQRYLTTLLNFNFKTINIFVYFKIFKDSTDSTNNWMNVNKHQTL